MSGSAKKMTEPINSSDLDAQKERAIKNYIDGKYKNVIVSSLSNNGTQCSNAKYDYKVTSKIFAPIFA